MIKRLVGGVLALVGMLFAATLLSSAAWATAPPPFDVTPASGSTFEEAAPIVVAGKGLIGSNSAFIRIRDNSDGLALLCETQPSLAEGDLGLPVASAQRWRARAVGRAV